VYALAVVSAVLVLVKSKRRFLRMCGTSSVLTGSIGCILRLRMFMASASSLRTASAASM